jgi:hypothetical protein
MELHINMQLHIEVVLDKMRSQMKFIKINKYFFRLEKSPIIYVIFILIILLL